MANFNKVILMGNLTRDPELKYLPSNTPVCEFGMAVNRKWRDREGNQHEEVCFVQLTAFARSAENINQYLSKGSPLMVEGRLKFDSWTAQDGSKRSRLSVVVENFQFLGGGRGEGGGARDQGGYSRGAPAGGPPADGGGVRDQGGHSRGAPAGGPPADGGYYQDAPAPGPPVDAPPPSGDDIPF